MIKTILGLLKKYQSIIAYMFFGVCTTLINMLVYYLCYDVSHIGNVISTVIAWVAAVCFAFITNKLWVFDSKSFEKKLLVKELLSFFGCRILTGILDVAIMYVTVDVLGLNAMLWKLLSNFLVIVLNYIASKLIIFKKRS